MVPIREVSLRRAEPPALAAGLQRLRAELDLPSAFPEPVLAEAEAAARAPRLPSVDRTEIEFVTLDPEDSLDLDQAFHLSRTADGYLLRYAIADVAAFVAPGGAIDREAHARGETLYAPTSRTALHPPLLSEGATSLLPGQDRPALVWELRLAADGSTAAASVTRAMIRSRAKLSYDGAQRQLDAGTGGEQLELLREIGMLRQEREADRGGVSLSVPEQEVVPTAESWSLAYRASLPVEDWNAQLSLATGMAAAQLMLEAKVGLLRTLPPAPPEAVDRLRRTAQALGISWRHTVAYPDFVRGLDASTPAHAAMLNACTLLFRGAGYVAFDGTVPEQPLHAAIAAPYAHVTAPLRRLADRYAGEVCSAICAGVPVPEWVAVELPELPQVMAESNRRAHRYERGVVNLVEAILLEPHVGESFTGTVIEVDSDRQDGILQLAEPAVEARVGGTDLVLGREVTATLLSADPVTGSVQFSVRP
jgi:exoribonuclease R